MQNRACVREIDPEFFPSAQAQPILQILAQVTLGRRLQPGHAALHGPAIQGCRLPRLQIFRFITEEGGPGQPDQVLFRFRVQAAAIAVQGEKGSQLLRIFLFPVGVAAQLLRQQGFGVPPSRDLQDGILLFRTAGPQPGEHFLQAADQDGRPDALAVHGNSGIGQAEHVRSFGHIQIEVEPLYIHLLPGGRGQFQPAGLQEFPVQVGDQAAPAGGSGNIAVVDTHKEEDLYLTETGPFHVAAQDPVHLLGQSAQTDLIQACFQQLQIIGCGNLLFSNQLIDLIQQLYDAPVDLGIFLLPGVISRLFKALRPLLHEGFCTAPGQEGIKLFCPFSCGQDPASAGCGFCICGIRSR